MIDKETLQYVVEMSAPIVEEYGSIKYTDKKLYPIKEERTAAPIEISTLSGLVEYIKSDIGDIYKDQKMLVHVCSPTRVSLISALNSDIERGELARADFDVQQFDYERFIDSEKFIIKLNSVFQETDARALLVQCAGTVESGTVAKYGDDGVSQKATIRTGIATKKDIEVPSPAVLRPYRTFLEVEQPASSFIFRMKDDGAGVCCALFEADGGAWRLEAMRNIKRYLQEALKDMPQFVVIS